MIIEIHLFYTSSSVESLTETFLLVGLNAARSFIERYAGHLEQLDLSLLLKFEPIQEMIIEKLDTRPEIFSSIDISVTEYLKQAPAHDMRLFIWTLEEHRDDYISCHTMLDEYFDMMGMYFKNDSHLFGCFFSLS